MNNSISRSCPKCKSVNLISNNTSFLRCKDCNYSWFIDRKRKTTQNVFDIDLITYKFRKNKKVIYILIGTIFLFFILNKYGFNFEDLEVIFTYLIAFLIVAGTIFLAGKLTKGLRERGAKFYAEREYEASKCSKCGTPNSYEHINQEWHGTYWVGQGLNR